MTKTSNRKPTIHEDVQATLERLEAEDPGLKQVLQKAYGYAVFPSVGKAALVIGGAYGRGEVYEKGKLIGYATIAQTTIGVQIGGDTFSQVIAFESKQSMDRFKKGKFAFAANASAVLVKAGAGGTADYEKGAKAFAYAEGGMLLEAAIGGQRFKFKPLGEEDEKGQGKQGKQQSGKASSGSASRGGGEGGEDEEGGSDDSGLAGRAAGGIREAVAKVAGLVKDHPVAATVIGVGAVGGIALLVTRAVRGSSAGSSADASGSGESEGDEGEARDESDSGSDEDREEQDDASDEGDDDARDEDQDEGQDEDQDEQDDQDDESDADESDDEDSGEDDADEGEEEEEETPRRGRSRARS